MAGEAWEFASPRFNLWLYRVVAIECGLLLLVLGLAIIIPCATGTQTAAECGQLGKIWLVFLAALAPLCIGLLFQAHRWAKRVRDQPRPRPREVEPRSSQPAVKPTRHERAKIRARLRRKVE